MELLQVIVQPTLIFLTHSLIHLIGFINTFSFANYFVFFFLANLDAESLSIKSDSLILSSEDVRYDISINTKPSIPISPIANSNNNNNYGKVLNRNVENVFTLEIDNKNHEPHHKKQDKLNRLLQELKDYSKENDESNLNSNRESDHHNQKAIKQSNTKLDNDTNGLPFQRNQRNPYSSNGNISNHQNQTMDSNNHEVSFNVFIWLCFPFHDLNLSRKCL